MKIILCLLPLISFNIFATSIVVDCKFLNLSDDLYGLEGIRIEENANGYMMVLYPEINEVKIQKWPVLKKVVDNGTWHEGYFNTLSLKNDTDYVTQLNIFHAVEEVGSEAFLGLPKLIDENGNFILDNDEIDVSSICHYL